MVPQADRVHAFLKNIAMTILTNVPTSATGSFAFRTAVGLARLRRLIHRLLAAVFAWQKGHAAREALCQLDDRTLMDIGIYRSQTDSRPEALAETRARMQQPGWS